MGRVRTVALAMTAACALVACSVAPIPDLDASVPPAWRHAGALPLEAPAPDLHRWWLALQAPELTALVDRALAHNLVLAEATERVLAARALADGAGLSHRPVLGASTQEAVVPGVNESWVLAGFDVGWELPLFGAAQGARRAATGQWHTAAADWRGARVSLVAEVVRCWIELRMAHGQLQLQQSMEEAAARRVQLAARQVELGLAPASAHASAQAALAQLQARGSDPAQRVQTRAQQLALLLGQDQPDADWFAIATLPQLAAPGLDQLPADLLRTQPSIARAEAQVVRAAGALDISRTQIYPHIGLGASLRWALTSSHGSLRSDGSVFSLGPVIDIPLFDWGQRVARERADAHELQAALLAYRQAVLQGVAETENALATLHQARLRAQAAQRAATALEQVASQTRKQRDFALASELDVVAAQLQSQQAQSELLQAHELEALAYVALYKALGGAPLADLPGQASAGHESVPADGTAQGQ